MTTLIVLLTLLSNLYLSVCIAPGQQKIAWLKMKLPFFSTVFLLFQTICTFAIQAKHLRGSVRWYQRQKYKDGYRDSSYDPGYGLNDGYTGKDMASGFGHIDGFNRDICKFGDSGADAKNIFDIGHKLASIHRYRDSADCFKRGIQSWWNIVRNSNPMTKKLGHFSPANGPAVKHLEAHLKGMYDRSRDTVFTKRVVDGKKQYAVVDRNKNQIPPQLLWLKEQKAKNAKK
jgi:hypothetical protein